MLLGAVPQKPGVLIKWPHFMRENEVIKDSNPTFWENNPEKLLQSPLRKKEQYLTSD